MHVRIVASCLVALLWLGSVIASERSSDNAEGEFLLVNLSLEGAEFQHDFRVLVTEGEPATVRFGQRDSKDAGGELELTVTEATPDRAVLSLLWRDPSIQGAPRAFRLMSGYGDASSVTLGGRSGAELVLGLTVDRLDNVKRSSTSGRL